MSVSNSYRTFILERLEVVGEITSRSMFGGVGIYCDGFFFALIADDTLYFKVDDSNRPDFESQGMGAFMPFKDSSNKEDMRTMQYYEAPADILEDDPLLRQWGQKALKVAQAAKQRKKRNTKK